MAKSVIGRMNQNQIQIQLERRIIIRRSDRLVFTPSVCIAEQVSGTLQPSTICDVHFYGMSSPCVGMIDNPGSQHLYWNIQGPLRCSQQFIPGANQSIAITVSTLPSSFDAPLRFFPLQFP